MPARGRKFRSSGGVVPSHRPLQDGVPSRYPHILPTSLEMRGILAADSLVRMNPTGHDLHLGELPSQHIVTSEDLLNAGNMYSAAEAHTMGEYAVTVVAYSGFVLGDDSIWGFWGHPLASVGAHTPQSESSNLLSRIGRLANQGDEEDPEPGPSGDVIDKISNLIRQASEEMKTPMRDGIVSSFYGEINVTWRNGDDIVRLACFADRPSILQFGNLSQPLAPYQSQTVASGTDLAGKLDELSRQVVC